MLACLGVLAGILLWSILPGTIARAAGDDPAVFKLLIGLRAWF